MPRRWQLEIEKEELDKSNEVCFLLEEELESEDIDELADFDFATELLLTELPYAALEEDTAKITNSALSPVPSSVAAALQEYAELPHVALQPPPRGRRRREHDHRVGQGQRAGMRSPRAPGSASQRVTRYRPCTPQRFLGFLKSHCEQAQPGVELFAHGRVGEWCQRWLEWLRTEHGLKASTLAVYTHGVLAVSSYACTLLDDPSACPTSQLLNLRRQAESIAKQERLFQPTTHHPPHPTPHTHNESVVGRSCCACRCAGGARRLRGQVAGGQGSGSSRCCAIALCWHFTRCKRPTASEVGAHCSRRAKNPSLPDPPCTAPASRLASRRAPAALGVSLYLKEGDAQYTVDLSTLRHKTRHASPTRPPPKRVHLTPAPLVQPLLRPDDPQPAGEPRRLGGRVGALDPVRGVARQALPLPDDDRLGARLLERRAGRSWSRASSSGTRASPRRPSSCARASARTCAARRASTTSCSSRARKR